VAELPEPERLILEPQILSILILPLTVHGQFFGFIGFDNCVQARMGSVGSRPPGRGGGSHFASARAQAGESLLLGQNEY